MIATEPVKARFVTLKLEGCQRDRRIDIGEASIRHQIDI